jgi:hypothetical protein
VAARSGVESNRAAPIFNSKIARAPAHAMPLIWSCSTAACIAASAAALAVPKLAASAAWAAVYCARVCTMTAAWACRGIAALAIVWAMS